MGYYAFGSKRPQKKHLTALFEKLEDRGKDASGYAYVDEKEGSLIVYKDCVRSTLLVKTEPWLKLTDLPKIMIFHTRAKTKGEPVNNMNNHPIFNKNGDCIVHNGMISNDDEVYKKIKVERDAQVDSEVILALMNSGKGNPVKRVFRTLRGSYAFASISLQRPDELILVRNSNPVKIYYNQNDDIMYFCSERDMMIKALGIANQSCRGFITDQGGYWYNEMADDHGLWIGPEGVRKYTKYESLGWSNYYSGYNVNRWDNSRWDDDKKTTPVGSQLPIKYEADDEKKDDDPYGYYDNSLEVACPHCNEEIYIEMGMDNWCDYCGQYLGHHYGKNNYLSVINGGND
jgi:asparagine synthetase B (glutamine-hydrolysing)